MIYWDTSCVVKLYVSEPDSEQWMQLARRQASLLHSSALLETELACAFRGKEQRNEIRVGATKILMDLFHRDVQVGRFRLFPLAADVHRKACHLVVENNTKIALRSLDALHLATCLHLECEEIATTDIKLSAAAKAAGIKVVLA